MLFNITKNNSTYKNDRLDFIAKMIVLKSDYLEINLYDMAGNLSSMGIDTLNIISINNKNIDENFQTFFNGSTINYMEMSRNSFQSILDNEIFLTLNHTTLYLLRDGSYLDLKNLFLSKNQTLTKNTLNIGRGGGQKSHLISPLELKINCYLLAMFNFNFNLINELNTFNTIDKDRYLLFHNT